MALEAGVERPADPRQDPMLQLAGALSSFNPELRGMLREQVAKQQDAAVTSGDLKAAELDAAKRMSEINSNFKTYVDDGTVPKSMLPFFQIGFNKRTGRELALTKYQSALDDRYKESTVVDGRVDPEQILAETTKSFREQLPNDLYAHQGFEAVASQVAQSFRERSNNEYRQNYEKAAETRIANEGVDRLQAMVLSDPDERETHLSEFRNYFNNLKNTELPKTHTAPFIVKNVVDPLVSDLVARGDFDGAEELVHQMEKFDVTGQGGLLGNMATTKGELAQMKLQIAERRRRADDPSESFQKKVTASYFRGTADAKVAVVNLGDATLDPATKQKLISDYKEQNAKDPHAVSSFQDYLDRAQREGVKEDTPSAVANVARLANTLELSQLTEAEETLKRYSTSGQLSPASELKWEGEISKRRNLLGLITDEELQRTERQIYMSERDDISRQVLPIFASADGYLSEALTREQRLDHRQSTMQFYREALAGRLRSDSFKTIDEAVAAMPQLRADALKETIAYADRLTANYVKSEEQKQKVVEKKAQLEGKAPPSKPKSQGQLGSQATGEFFNNMEKKLGGPPTRNSEVNLAEAVSVLPTDDPGNNDRRRAAFVSFFTELVKGPYTFATIDNISRGSVPEWFKDPNKAGLEFKSEDAIKQEVQARKTIATYHSVRSDYYDLRKFRERTTDAGDPNYIKRLREYAQNLKTYGGAEWLSKQQMADLGLNPDAFPTVGLHAGVIE